MSTDVHYPREIDERGSASDADASGRSTGTQTRHWSWRLLEALGQRTTPVRQRLGLSPSRQYQQTLVGAEIPTSPELYLAGALGVGLLVGTVLGGAGVGLGVALLGTPATASEAGLLAGIGVGLFATGVTGSYVGIVRYPKALASRRARQIDLGLSDVVSFMYTTSVSGMHIVEVLEAAGEAQSEYGEVAREFQRLVQRMNYFGEDYRTAIEHVRDTTPSDELARFLTGLISVLDSGGNVQAHLEREKDTFLEEVKRAREVENDTIELLGHVYMVAKLAPILLLILYVIIMFTQSGGVTPLAIVIYVLMPTLVAGYLVVLSLVTTDRVGSGRIDIPGREIPSISSGMLETPILERYAERDPDLFGAAHANERQYRWRRVLRNPVAYWKERPTLTLVVTVPLTLLTLGVLVVAGVATPTVQGFIDEPTVQTVVWVYLPAFVVLGPLGLFYEWNARDERALKRTLTEDLRKLGEANRYSSNLREAFEEVGSRGHSRLSEELARVETNRRYGIPIEASIVDITRRYESPRVGRVMKIIQTAQEADEQISEVLETAAELSKIQDDLEEDRRAGTQQQATIVGFSYLVLIVIVMILMTFFQPLAAGASSQGGSGNDLLTLSVQPGLMSVLYLHALVIDALGTGMVVGYIRTLEVAGMVKYMLAFLLVGLVAWVGIPPVIQATGIVPSVG